MILAITLSEELITDTHVGIRICLNTQHSQKGNPIKTKAHRLALDLKRAQGFFPANV